MPNVCLTQIRVDRLNPCRKTYDLRDRELRGFGVRVLTTGVKRYFIQSQHQGVRAWHQIGDAGEMTVEEARSRARKILAAIRNGDESATADPEETRFEVVAEKLFESCQRYWKAGTRKVNGFYFRNQILPWFRDMQIAEITNRDVKQWHASLHATPVAADRSAPVLSVLMRKAELHGYRPEGSNPCVGIRRYRRRGRERFLSPDEMQRLGVILAGHEKDRPQEVVIIRLLLLTGCRRGEILTLKWSDYREGHLFLRDSKTGPRMLWLSTPARRLLDGLPRCGAWIFPARRKRGHLPEMTLENCWWKMRVEAGIDDVRLHDLRHTYASVALRSGETVPTIARLLGHNDPATTLKYTHLNHDAVREAVAIIAPVLAGRV